MQLERQMINLDGAPHLFHRVSASSSSCEHRVLIMNDEPRFSKKLKTMLSGLGYEVTISDDAKLSYAFSLKNSDIVFIGIRSHQFSGRQVLEQLAHQHSKSPIILIGVDFQRLETAEKSAWKLGLNVIAALEKPFHLIDLQDVLPATG